MTEQLLTELKQYAFALYIGQRVLMYSDKSLSGSLVTSAEIGRKQVVEKGCLHLRNLSSITDDEAIEIKKIVYGDKVNETQFILIKDGIINMFNNGWNIHGTKMIAIFDCLRGFGIALPIYFKGVQYSIERLQELGIYTLNQ